MSYEFCKEILVCLNAGEVEEAKKLLKGYLFLWEDLKTQEEYLENVV